MIIQCKQCTTKFRFKDELMVGDGVWVRCGRCGHEFFEIKHETGYLCSADQGATGQGKAGSCNCAEASHGLPTSSLRPERKRRRPSRSRQLNRSLLNRRMSSRPMRQSPHPRRRRGSGGRGGSGAAASQFWTPGRLVATRSWSSSSWAVCISG